MAQQVVFVSPYQDEVDAVDVGLKFSRDVPQTVTDEQAERLLSHPHFKKYEPAPRWRSAPPPADKPEPAAD